MNSMYSNDIQSSIHSFKWKSTENERWTEGDSMSHLFNLERKEKGKKHIQKDLVLVLTFGRYHGILLR